MCATYMAWYVAHKVFILANGLEGIKLYLFFFFSPPIYFGCAFVKQEGNTISHNQLSDLVSLPGDHEGLVSSLSEDVPGGNVGYRGGRYWTALRIRAFCCLCFLCPSWWGFHLGSGLVPMDIFSPNPLGSPDFQLYTFPHNHNSHHIFNPYCVTNDL